MCNGAFWKLLNRIYKIEHINNTLKYWGGGKAEVYNKFHGASYTSNLIVKRNNNWLPRKDK